MMKTFIDEIHEIRRQLMEEEKKITPQQREDKTNEAIRLYLISEPQQKNSQLSKNR